MSDWWIPALIVAVLGLCIWAAVEEERQWKVYAAEHHCVKFGRMRGSNGVGISSSGSVVSTYTPGKTGYRCDGGEEIWR